MRVLMFGWEFPPHITGGLGTACHGLSSGLAPLVDKITFVLPRVKGEAPIGAVEVRGVDEFHGTLAAGEQAGLEMIAVPSSLRPYMGEAQYERWLRPADGSLPAPGDAGGMLRLSGDYGANLFEEVGRYAAVAGRIARERDFDVVHAHDWMTFMAGVEAKRTAGTPLVAHVHALEFDRSGESIDTGIFEIERLGMEKADRVIAVSRRTAALAVQRYGIAPDKIRVVHNGAVRETVTGKRLRHPLGGPLVVFLGRITMQKGPEYFLETARLVADADPTARFAMAGNGDLLPRMIERMAELGLMDRFHFTGFVDAKRRDELLRQADVLVMPSVSEPFGIVPLEAVARDVPVVICKQSGVAEVLNGAFKVDFWDVRRTADAIVNLIASPALGRQLRAAATADLAVICWDKAAGKVRDVYREIVSA